MLKRKLEVQFTAPKQVTLHSFSSSIFYSFFSHHSVVIVVFYSFHRIVNSYGGIIFIEIFKAIGFFVLRLCCALLLKSRSCFCLYNYCQSHVPRFYFISILFISSKFVSLKIDFCCFFMFTTSSGITKRFKKMRIFLCSKILDMFK